MRSKRAALCLLGVLAAAGCARPPGPPARVVVVVIDTLRADHLPPYGYGLDTAPFLSQLAREGVVFEHAYSPASWTAPATASLFTSLYPFQHGVVLGLRATRKLKSLDERVRLRTLPEELETMPEAMKRAGYATFGLTHNLNVSKEMGFAQGFERFWHSPSQDSADDLNVRLLEWKDRLAAPPRAFLYLHYLDPHSPYRERAPWFDENTVGRAREISAYDSEIRFVDEHLRVAYDALGWGRDTLLVVTADHGEEFWEHGDFGHGHSLFGEVLNIPLIVRFPDGRGGGRRVSAPVSLLDVLPTLRECVGQAREARDEGRSLMPLVRDPQAASGERTLYAHLYRPDATKRHFWDQRAVLHKRRKVVTGLPDGPRLFDLSTDPLDAVDLAKDEPRVVDDLQSLYVAFEHTARRIASDESELTLDPDVLERLRALGYLQ